MSSNDWCPVCRDTSPHMAFGDQLGDGPAHRWPEGFAWHPESIAEWKRRTKDREVVLTDE